MFEHTEHVVVKVTRDCNLRCKYCYVADKDNYRGERMSFSVFKTLVDRIIEDKIKAGTQQKRISFTFHGGEPTIIGPDMLKKFAIYASNSFVQNGINYSLSIQTNATLLTDEILQIFHDYNFNVGISFDGIGKSNLYRTSKPTRDYIETIKKLKKYGLSFGSIIVVNQSNINYVKKNIKFFKKIGLNGKFNYAEDVHHIGGCEVSGEELFDKMFIPLCEEYLKPGTKKYIDPNVDELIKKYFNSLISSFFFGHPQVNNFQSICGSMFCGAGKKVVEVSPDGSMNYCGRYDRDSPASNCGSIFQKDFLGLFSLKKYVDFVNKKREVINSHPCDSCAANIICDFGCMAFHYSSQGTWGIREDLVCSYYPKVFRYIALHKRDFLLSYMRAHRTPSHNGQLFFYKSFHCPQGCNAREKVFKVVVPQLRKICPNILIEEDPDWQGPQNTCQLRIKEI